MTTQDKHKSVFSPNQTKQTCVEACFRGVVMITCLHFTNLETHSCHTPPHEHLTRLLYCPSAWHPATFGKPLQYPAQEPFTSPHTIPTTMLMIHPLRQPVTHSSQLQRELRSNGLERTERKNALGHKLGH